MKIKSLKNYGIPSCIVNIWEKNPSPYLLPLQEDAIRNYGILSCGEGSTGLPRRFAPRNDRMGASRNDRNNLLVIAPASSGKSFIGEMAAISQATHHKKIIYLLPLRSPAEEKYRHFKNLYKCQGDGSFDGNVKGTVLLTILRDICRQAGHLSYRIREY